VRLDDEANHHLRLSLGLLLLSASLSPLACIKGCALCSVTARPLALIFLIV
jgi:hypothetical protein